MTDYVLVIHGTFSAPEPSVKKWYQFDPNNKDNFCQRLNEALADGPLHGAVWREGPQVVKHFQETGWKGDNTHESRLDGADKLCSLLLELRRKDPSARIHIVAHSHGGNVVLQALERYFDGLSQEANNIVLQISKKLHSEEGFRELLQYEVTFDRNNSKLRDALREAIIEICGKELCNTDHFKTLVESFLIQDKDSTSSVGSADPFRKLCYDILLKLYRNPVMRPLSLKIATYAKRSRFDRFIKEWGKSSQSIRIGRLVFMGTPFFYKRWLPMSGLSRSVNKISRGFTFFLKCVVSCYMIVIYFSFIFAIIPFINFIGFNPFNWPTVCLALYATILLIVFGLEMFTQSYNENRNVNMYYTKNLLHKLPCELDALVLSAGFLDEALSGLSIEPLVFGYIAPQLDKSFSPDFFPNRRILSGESHDNVSQIRLMLYYLFSAFSAASLRLTRWWLQPRVTELILDSAASAGFGLPIEEFTNSIITPRLDLELQGVIQSNNVISVTKLFANARFGSAPLRRPENYDFLWDIKSLETKLITCVTWHKVESRIEQLKKYMLREDEDKDFILWIQRLCLIIELRAKEFGGMLELHHCEYYGNQNVINAIARFLVNGERPAGDEINTSDETKIE